jgi:predicted outer membrane repeat protein
MKTTYTPTELHHDCTSATGTMLRVFMAAVLFTSGLSLIQPARADWTYYYLSGGTNAPGSVENPQGAIAMQNNDWVILSATASTREGFVPLTTLTYLQPDRKVVSRMDLFVGMNGVADTMNIYSEQTPYADLMKLMPASLIPNIVSNSDMINLLGFFQQDKERTPAPYNTITSNPVNVWPLNIVSSDSLDATGNFRLDMQNAAWAAVTYAPDASKNTLMQLYGDYNDSPRRGNQWSITLEHVIFTGGYTSQGGGLKVLGGITEGITQSPNNFPTVIIQGDVAFINNVSNGSSTSNGGGGAYVNGGQVQFQGNAYFIANLCGAAPNADFGGAYVFNNDPTNGLSGGGGGIRVYTGGNDLYFYGESYFIGNLAGGLGGGAAVPTNGKVTFGGKTVFMGNRSGMYISMGGSTNGGGAGLSGLNGTGTFLFNNEAYFIGNKASGPGGGMFGGNNIASAVFNGKTLFSDNSAGVMPYEGAITVVLPQQGGKVPEVMVDLLELDGSTQPGGVYTATTTLGATDWASGTSEAFTKTKVGGGGAIWASSGNVVFKPGAKAEFLRNSAYGSGGAIGSMAGNTNTTMQAITNSIIQMAYEFQDDAVFVGNYAAVNGGAISVGTFGSWNSAIYASNTSNIYAASVYFSGSNKNLTVKDNVSWWGESGTKVEVITGVVQKSAAAVQTGTALQYGGGGIFATAGVYVENVYTFDHNQTGGYGGAILVSGVANNGSRPTLVKYGTGAMPYAMILNPLDWAPAGTYTKDGQFALIQNNVSMEGGGAIGGIDTAKFYIGSGAQFLNNSAGGHGGAIMMGIPVTNFIPDALNRAGDAGALDIKARVADVIFKGNRQLADVDARYVDSSVITNVDNTTAAGFTGTGGYMTVTPGSGRPNDIYVDIGSISSTNAIVATIAIDAYEGMKAYFDGGIEMDNSKQTGIAININTKSDVGTAITGSNPTVAPVLLDNTTPVGLVVFDDASADVEAITTIGHGTLRIQGTSNSLVWGSGTSTTREGTLFALQSPATLEANATINAEGIIIGDGATVRVLGSDVGMGTLTLNSGTGISYEGAINMAGNGMIYAGISDFDTTHITSIAVGDVVHTSAQSLLLAKDSSISASVTLNDSTISAGLFGGASSDNFNTGSITLGGVNTINLTSLASGTYNIVTATDGSIGGASTFSLFYQGNDLLAAPIERVTQNVNVIGSNIVVEFTSSNQVMTWNGGNGAWDITSGNWTGGGGATVATYGDAIVLGAAAVGNNIALTQNVLASGMSTNGNGNYTFTGDFGITTDAGSWGGAAVPGDATGAFIKAGGANTTVTFANAWNNFMNGISIKSGTVSVGTAAQLGAALSKITFDTASATDRATLLITGNVRLSSDDSLAPQRLILGTGQIGNIDVAPTGALTISNNEITGDGGAINVGDNATLTLNAGGSISILNNTAAHGGGIALGDNATLNVDVGTDAVVMIGLRDDSVLNTAANVTTKDSIYGGAGSVINKDGAGVFSLNSNSMDFSGAINVNAGSLIGGAGSIIGSAGSAITARNAGSKLGGATTFGGNVDMGQGTYLQIGRGDTRVSERLTILGDLTLDDVTLLYAGAVSQSGVYTVDELWAANATLSGTTIFDLKRIAPGVNTVISSSNSIVTDYLAGIAPNLVAGGNGIAVFSTTVVTTMDYSTGTAIATTVVYGDSLPVAGGDTLLTSKDGVLLTGGRFEADVGYDVSSEVKSVEYGYNTVTTVIDYYYDTTKLMLTTNVYNQKSYWTGTGGDAWDVSAKSWDIPAVANEVTFADGDSVVFGKGTYAGAGISGNTVTVKVDNIGVSVADMTITGSNNWVFTGGPIKSNAGGNNYRDADGNELSLGNLVLDENYTGLVELDVLSARFRGIMTASGTLSDGIVILGGTLQASAEVVRDNTILNEKTLIIDQPTLATYVGYVHGSGDIVKTGVGTLWLKDSTLWEADNLHLDQGRLVIDITENANIKGTLYISNEADLIVRQELAAGTLVNAGRLYRDSESPIVGANKKPTTSNLISAEGITSISTDAILPQSGANRMTIWGNYVGEAGSQIILNTYRESVFIDNIEVMGNSSGTTSIIVRNIMAMPYAPECPGLVFVPGDASTPGTFSSTASMFTSGSAFYNPDGKSYSVNAPEPQRYTLIFKTNGAHRDVKLVMDWANSYLPEKIDVDAGGEDDEGNPLYARSSVPEPTSNYTLVQGADSNWYFLNRNAALHAQDLPYVSSAPMIADLIAKAGIKAIYQRINTRHDKLRKGWDIWTNYIHSEDRLRKEAFGDSMFKQDAFHLGGDYAFSDEAENTGFHLSAGGALSIARGESIAPNQNKLIMDVTTLSGYASLRWWRLYLDGIIEYSPNASYESTTSDPFDLNGTVKGSRITGSAEFGIITNPIGGGQLEIYGQISSHKHSFDNVSAIGPMSDFDTVDGYNLIYDPNSPNGRRYHFDSPATMRGEVGFRWGSNLNISKDLTLRPWGGLAYGRNIRDDYNVYMHDELGDKAYRADLRGNFYTARGGAAVQWRDGIQVYLTLEWTGGSPTNNYTLMSGINYHW